MRRVDDTRFLYEQELRFGTFENVWRREGVIPPHHDPACWGCGDAPGGIRLPQPAEEGLREYEAWFHFDERHQARPGLVHGGLVAAALDEACGLLVDLVPLSRGDGADLRPLPAAGADQHRAARPRAAVRASAAGGCTPTRASPTARTCSPRRAARSSTCRSSTSSRRPRGARLLTLGSAGSRTDSHSDGVTPLRCARDKRAKRFRHLRRRGKDAARAEAHLRRRSLHPRADGRGQGRPRPQDHRADRASALAVSAVIQGTVVEACKPGKLEGRPDLTKRDCITAGIAGKLEYWRCPAEHPGDERRALAKPKPRDASYHGPSTSRPALRVSLSATETPAPGATCSPRLQRGITASVAHADNTDMRLLLLAASALLGGAPATQTIAGTITANSGTWITVASADRTLTCVVTDAKGATALLQVGNGRPRRHGLQACRTAGSC